MEKQRHVRRRDPPQQRSAVHVVRVKRKAFDRPENRNTYFVLPMTRYLRARRYVVERLSKDTRVYRVVQARARTHKNSFRFFRTDVSVRPVTRRNDVLGKRFLPVARARSAYERNVFIAARSFVVRRRTSSTPTERRRRRRRTRVVGDDIINPSDRVARRDRTRKVIYRTRAAAAIVHRKAARARST